MIERLESFIATKTLREKFLFALLVLVGIFYFLHFTLLEKIQLITALNTQINQYTLKTNDNLKHLFLQEKELNAKLKTLSFDLRSQIPSSSNLLKILSEYMIKHSLTLTYSSIQKLDQTYALHLQSYGEFEDLIKLINLSLSLPTLSLHSFKITQDLNLNLVLIPKNMISPPQDTILPISPDSVLQALQTQISSPTLLSLHNPFSSHHINLTLEAIINQRARINGTWLSQGEKIHGHTLKEITQDFVTLDKQGSLQRLDLYTKKVFR